MNQHVGLQVYALFLQFLVVIVIIKLKSVTVISTSNFLSHSPNCLIKKALFLQNFLNSMNLYFHFHCFQQFKVLEECTFFFLSLHHNLLLIFSFCRHFHHLELFFQDLQLFCKALLCKLFS